MKAKNENKRMFQQFADEKDLWDKKEKMYVSEVKEIPGDKKQVFVKYLFFAGYKKVNKANIVKQ